ncbi:hypothetical protein [Streptomyces sp. NBC_00102]|uniref:hypothetical protein n=1 Tax=Streptomyces sp. NBC_00102 TaxID=2975652 RepID=UPI00224D788D|nr:hypothetical protein [Streptomyces sp. NBC_00102]MCX5399731.1 hypothetical protein [Streptomyces sp. NBC_00102]
MTTPPPQQPGPFEPPTPPSQQPGPFGPPAPPSQQPPQYPPYPGQPNPPQPQPGYGYPNAPQQPGFGDPNAPQQPGYGYPNAPQPGYGHPNAPQPQSGWGQPGMPGMPGQPTAPGWPQQQPPRKKPVKLIVGIVVGALVVAAGVVYGVAQLVDKGSDAAFPEAKNKLVVQKTLLDGEFTLFQDRSATEGKEIEDTPDLSIRDPKAVVVQYDSEDGGVLIVSGMYGRIANPAFTRGSIMKGAAGSGGGDSLAVPAKKFTPDGYDITIECQVQQSGTGDAVSLIPMCAWGDDNTGAMVAILRADDVTLAPEDIDLEKAAEETAKVREEMLKPIG